MKRDASTLLSRPYEQHRRIEFEHQLARIRICYTVFCLTILFAALEHLEISLGALILFTSTALLYGLFRYFKPTSVPEDKRLPLAIDFLDLLFIAVLIYITGGIKSFFLVAYALPIYGDIIMFGLQAGMFDYAIALGITGLMYFINTDGPSAPLLFHLIAGAGTLAFAAWIVGFLAEKDWKLRDEIYLSSITDHQSGLYNSSYLRARIGEEIERCSREGTGFALSFIDLDHFKLVNDQHGHLVGDRVLKQIADLLTENIRKSDVLARYGGDEFVLLMPGTGTEQAEKVMRRIKNAVAASAFLENIKIGLSSGMAFFPEDGDSLDKLLTAADERMYKKKKHDSTVSYPGGRTGYQQSI